jgi:streptogramin lyase
MIPLAGRSLALSFTLVCLHSLISFGAPRVERILTIAGNGQDGFSGDGGLATEARLNNPYGVVRGAEGAYFCDMANHRIRRLARDGKIATVAGSGERGYSGDGGPATLAQLNEPYEIRFDSEGNMYFVEMKNAVIRRVAARTKLISTIAGTGKEGFSGDGGLATQATFRQPHSIQFDRNGDLYVCDIGNHRIRRIDMKTGIITTFAGTGEKAPTPDGSAFIQAPIFGPRAIDFDSDGNLWLALREGNAVYRLDMVKGTIHHAAGTGQKGFTGNGGPAKQATLSGPKGISIGPDRNVYFADTESHSIRRINIKSGNLELVAGTGQRGDGPDGDPLLCKLSRPHGIFVDRDGTIIIGDSENHRVRVWIRVPDESPDLQRSLKRE